MTSLIFLFFVFSIVTAVILEAVKKLAFGHKDEQGHRKTKLTAMQVRIIAGVLSVVEACLMCVADGFTSLGWYLLPAWSIILYAAQYIVDMKFIKRVFDAIVERIRG